MDKQTNAGGIDALLGELAPDAEQAPPLNDTEVARLVALAIDPNVGEAFTVGGRTFTLRFLTIDADRTLHNLLATGGRIDAIMATILGDQAPADVAWVNSSGAPREELIAIIERQTALNAQVPLMGQTFDIRRTRWSDKTSRGGGVVDVPSDARQTMFIEWACRTFTTHPAQLYRTFSQALLLALFDSWWWAHVAMPPESGDSGPPVGSSGGSDG